MATKKKIVKKAPADKPRKKATAMPADALVGRRAPKLPLPKGASVTGRAHVVYFYPRDDTPGCTREACDFRDHWTRLARAGVRVIGVSPDSEASHGRFREKYELPFTLVSDADNSVARAYSVWVKKQNYGREYLGIERSTFLVDAKGVVRRAWRRVKVEGHVEEVLAAAREL